MIGIYLFTATTPKSELVSFHGKNEATIEKEKTHEPGFLEGLRILLAERYLLGIFGIIAFNEIIATIIDFQFQSLVFSGFSTEAERASYLGDYAVWVNLVTFLSLLFGVGNIQRRLGIKTSLVLVPIVLLGMVFAFWSYPVVHVLFWIMVGAKALSYALNSPAQKQLYVPTTPEVRYKSQAWIEAFGSRGSKAVSSGFNLLKGPFETWFGPTQGFAHLINFGALLSLGMLGAWVIVALYLGNRYQKAVDQNKVVC